VSNKHAFAISELHFVDTEAKEKVAVQAHSTLSLPKEVYDDFDRLNAVRPATEDEFAAAKAREFPGVERTSLETPKSVVTATQEAEAAAAAAATAAKTDAKASEKVAAQSDANREAAKTGATGGKTADKPADPLA